MRLKRLMSIVLATLLVMSFAMSASAGSLYYAQDFNYESIVDMGNDAYNINANGTLANNQVFDVATYRNSGKNIMIDHGGWLAAVNAGFAVNGDGNNALYLKSSSRTIAFIPDDSWDGKTNQTETYVISLDVDPVKLGSAHSFLNVIGLRGNAETPAYNRARILTHGYGKMLTVEGNHYGGDDLGITQGGETKRVALALNYDATTGGFKRAVAVDDELKKSNLTFELENMTTVEGISFAMDYGATPRVGKIRMYTINNDIDFAVSGITDDSVAPTADKVTVKLNRPIPSTLDFDVEVYEVTDDGDKLISGYIVGDIETFILDEDTNEVYSTVDINFTGNFKETTEYKIVFTENDKVTDEIGNKLSASGNFATFTTGENPKFGKKLSVNGNSDINFDNLTSLKNNKIHTFEVEFENKEAFDVGAVIFIGIYDADKLVDFSFAKTTLEQEGKQKLSLSTKINKDGMKLKAVAVGNIKDIPVADADYSKASGINN